jgi:hypothetical protein
MAVRAVDVSDYEIITAYSRLEDGVVSVRQRTVVYLDPRQPRYFDAGSRAVGVFDAAARMARQPAPADAPPGAVACVATPKDVSQCV